MRTFGESPRRAPCYGRVPAKPPWLDWAQVKDRGGMVPEHRAGIHGKRIPFVASRAVGYLATCHIRVANTGNQAEL